MTPTYHTPFVYRCISDIMCIGKEHLIFYKAQKAVCPKCGGTLVTMKSDTIVLNCFDCDAYFVLVGEGQAEAELTFREAEFA